MTIAEDPARTRLMRRVGAIVVISEFLQRYVQEHGGLRSTLVRLPIYGARSSPLTARPDRGFVTLVNPCAVKGLDVFLALADRLPDVAFAAVPTWGADEEVLRALRARPNITLLEPADDIGEILAVTRVLLAPSLWPETFGYVVPEALLRGIPVLAADLGGLPEAGLGAATLLPVVPLERRGGEFLRPEQPVAPWVAALRRLLEDRALYAEHSARARRAAAAFVAGIDVARLERLFAASDVPA
jgi:glycosyltransferase involved in cell wall biosynthesis